MFRRSLIIALILAVVPVVAAAWVWSPVLLEAFPDPKPTPPSGGSKQVAAEIPDLDALKPRDGTAKTATFDVARVDPGGWSVFAGTAPANSNVTVTADGVPIGTSKADERGEWSLVSEHRFSHGDPVLGLSTQFEPPTQKPVASQQESPAAEQRPAEPRSTVAGADPSGRMMRDFESLVAAAREPKQPERPQATVRAPVPIPIQFVFRRAEFTDEGRNAVALLSEYLKLKKPESIVLTGHADERGREVFNLILSRRRLETVADYLKQNGYSGRLVLVPKGSSEPYRGVDRTALDRRTLWQLDRRVELDFDAEKQPPHRLGQQLRE